MRNHSCCWAKTLGLGRSALHLYIYMSYWNSLCKIEGEKIDKLLGQESQTRNSSRSSCPIADLISLLVRKN